MMRHLISSFIQLIFAPDKQLMHAVTLQKCTQQCEFAPALLCDAQPYI